MRRSVQASIFAVLSAAVLSASSAASAGSEVSTRTFGHGKVSVETVVEFGNNIQPVVIEQSSQINIARVIEIGTGQVDATIIQTGTTNYANILQVGSTTNAAIAQLGMTNNASVTQMGNVNNALMLQIGNLNTGGVRQFGHFNWAAIFQFGR